LPFHGLLQLKVLPVTPTHVLDPLWVSSSLPATSAHGLYKLMVFTKIITHIHLLSFAGLLQQWFQQSMVSTSILSPLAHGVRQAKALSVTCYLQYFSPKDQLSTHAW
jgi:hypothetical protein